MKYKLNKINAFTLAETLIVIVIIAIIVLVTMKIQKSQANYINKFMCYSAYTNLKKGVEELIVTGYTSGSNTIHELRTGPGQFCIDLSQLYNYNLPSGAASLSAACARNFAGTPTDADFANGSTINFITTNGIKFYNLGSNPVTDYYELYLDIDGSKRDAKLNEDVIKFRAGIVSGDSIPDADSIAANNTEYLSASVRYWDATNAKYVSLVSGVNYRQAVCTAGQRPSIDINYCSNTTNYPTSYSANTNCNNGTYACEVVIEKPRFIFL